MNYLPSLDPSGRSNYIDAEVTCSRLGALIRIRLQAARTRGIDLFLADKSAEFKGKFSYTDLVSTCLRVITLMTINMIILALREQDPHASYVAQRYPTQWAALPPETQKIYNDMAAVASARPKPSTTEQSQHKERDYAIRQLEKITRECGRYGIEIMTFLYKSDIDEGYWITQGTTGLIKNALTQMRKCRAQCSQDCRRYKQDSRRCTPSAISGTYWKARDGDRGPHGETGDVEAIASG